MVKKVMVVDDEPGVIFTVKRGIEGFDKTYEVISADSGRKCLELLENNKIPDIILLDIMMPDMSGWETLKKIKQNDLWKNIPVVFLTARTDIVAKKAGGFLGDDYIEKPFKIPELKERIDRILKNK
jgi:CheY-like chemotaxis protein